MPEPETPEPFVVDASGPLLDIDPEHARTDADTIMQARDLIALMQEASDGPDSILLAAFRDAAGPLANLERGLREAAEQ